MFSGSRFHQKAARQPLASNYSAASFLICCFDVQDLLGKVCTNQNVPITHELIASTVLPLKSTRFGKKQAAAAAKAKRAATMTTSPPAAASSSASQPQAPGTPVKVNFFTS